MNFTKTIDFNVHYVNTLLKSKGIGSLAVVQALIDEFKSKRQSWEQALLGFKDKQEKLLQSKTHSEVPFKKLLQEKEAKMLQLEQENHNKLKLILENSNKLKSQILMTNNEETKKNIEMQVLQLKDQILKSNENLVSIKAKHKETTSALIQKQNEFLVQIQSELSRLDVEISDTKNLIQKSLKSQLKLDNLHHAISKNPVTLFNDKITHDLILFAHKDVGLKTILNDFLDKYLDQKEYQQIIDKVGKLMEEVFQKSKSSNVLELIHIYSNMLKSVLDEGITRLDKPITIILIDPEIEKALRQYRNDISLAEVIQIAKLSPEVQQKVLSLPICVDFFIQLMRSELKAFKGLPQTFVPSDINWEALIYLTKKWPIFFRRFGQSLNTFSEREYIKLFQSTIHYASQILKNPVSEQIFSKVIFLRERSKETFQSNYKTSDYIRLLHDTVAMAISNELRNPHHTEVIKIYTQLVEPFQSLFLKIFDENDILKMLMQAESTPLEQQENIYVRIDRNFENIDKILRHFRIKEFEDLPGPIVRFLKSIHVDASDHLAQIDNIIEKINLFEKNISLSVISSDKQIPLANGVFHSVIRCCEYIASPKAMESMIITKELEKVFFRKTNSQK